MEYDWGYIMDWAQIIAVVVGVLTILGVIIKDMYASKGNTNLLQKEHSIIIDKINGVATEIKSKASELLRTLTHSIDQILQKTTKLQDTVNSIDKQLTVEAVRRENMEKNLTKEQMDASRQIQAINYVNEQMAYLQTRVAELTTENQILKRENIYLKEQISDLSLKYKREHRRSRDHDMEM